MVVWLTRLLSVLTIFVVSFAVDARAQDGSQKKLIEDLKALTKTLEAQNSIDNELTDALTVTKDSIEVLLNPELTQLQDILTAAKDTIDNNLDNTEIAELVDALRESAFDYLDANQNTYISMLAAALVSDFGADSNVYSKATRDQIIELAAIIELVENSQPIESIDSRAIRLLDLIKKSPQVQSGEVTIDSLDDLKSELLKIEGLRFYVALDSRITRLDETLALDISGDYLRVTDITKLISLKDKIEKLPAVADVTSGIHILSARFGNLLGSGKRATCDVRAAMVKLCEGKTKCSLPSVAPSGFCEDPVPFTQSKYKGVAVSYVCIRATKRQWTALLGSRNSPYANRAKSTVLRTTADEIRCAVE